MAIETEQFQQDIPLDRTRKLSISGISTENELQAYLLDKVSRTFALTIPQLPPALRTVVSNAYLLCRIVDTIEDEPALNAAQKREFSQEFVAVVKGESAASAFAERLGPMLSSSTIPAEHELIQLTPAIIQITHGLSSMQRGALSSCVRVMAEGMSEFQQTQSLGCLRDLDEMGRYCYFVAGIVGELLTELYCDYSPEIALHRDRLMSLSISFGQGLQMTNILKDIWDDRRRGACWLPRETFVEAGFNLRDLSTGCDNEAFQKGLEHLIGVAHGHLRNALTYTLLIPAREKGIRNFCSWAIGMALLTLRAINRRRDFSESNQVKITRRSVKATTLACRLFAGNDKMLELLFDWIAVGLPSSDSKLV